MFTFSNSGDTSSQCDRCRKAFESVLCKTESGLGNSELAVMESHSVRTSAVRDDFIKWCLCAWLRGPKMDVFEVVGYSSIGK